MNSIDLKERNLMNITFHFYNFCYLCYPYKLLLLGLTDVYIIFNYFLIWVISQHISMDQLDAYHFNVCASFFVLAHQRFCHSNTSGHFYPTSTQFNSFLIWGFSSVFVPQSIYIKSKYHDSCNRFPGCSPQTKITVKFRWQCLPYLIKSKIPSVVKHTIVFYRT